MFVRKKANRSGSTSVQVIQKVHGRYKVLKTIGCATTLHEIGVFEQTARKVIEKLMAWLETLSYPGNVRELRNLVERTVLLSEDDLLDIKHFRHRQP